MWFKFYIIDLPWQTKKLRKMKERKKEKKKGKQERRNTLSCIFILKSGQYLKPVQNNALKHCYSVPILIISYCANLSLKEKNVITS
jgi:hypothetical protein